MDTLMDTVFVEIDSSAENSVQGLANLESAIDSLISKIKPRN